MDDTLSLDGRAAIVTGAGQGLGRAEALALAAAGAALVLNDLPGDAVHDIAGEIQAAGGQAVVAAGDVGRLGHRRAAWWRPPWRPTAAWTSWSTTRACSATGWCSPCPSRSGTWSSGSTCAATS